MTRNVAVMWCRRTTEAADACQLRRCKYAEVSATLGHRVDELLVGIVKQIQLLVRRHRTSSHGSRQPSIDDAAAAGSGGGGWFRRQRAVVTVAVVDGWTHQGGDEVHRQRLARQTAIVLLRPHETLSDCSTPAATILHMILTVTRRIYCDAGSQLFVLNDSMTLAFDALTQHVACIDTVDEY